MKRLLVGWAWPALGLLVTLAAPFALSAPGCEVQELIRQLGDKQPKVREAATRQLLELKGAETALHAALKSSDPEVARRAAWILKERDRRSGERALARLQEHARHGEVDQAVEILVRRPQWADENTCWQALTGLAAQLIERGRKEFGADLLAKGLWHLPAGDFGRYVKRARPLFLTGTRLHPDKDKMFKLKHLGFVARGTDMILERSARVPYDSALIAAAGSFRYDEALDSSVIYSSGPVTMLEIDHSVLVCDGDLKVETISNSLVIVRGDVYCVNPFVVRDSLIILSGRFHLGKPTWALDKKTTKVREQQPDFLGFVKFFDPAREGVEVEPAKGGVRIKAAADGKPFAKAGLAAGDLVVAVNGQPAESPEVFRRLLRRTFVTGETTVLRVERDGKQSEVRVPGRQ
ncbi:MAG: PDZ domain-containing protein [Gemmataceae bacterium]|nr:PDZ domain-containing protein [Gemmataceae bacterium]